jgi:hypothetical protein
VNYHWPNSGGPLQEYPTASQSAIVRLLLFPTTYLCEVAFSRYAETDTKYWNRLDIAPKHEDTGLHHHSKFSVTWWQAETTYFLTLIQGKMAYDFPSIITVSIHIGNDRQIQTITGIMVRKPNMSQ